MKKNLLFVVNPCSGKRSKRLSAEVIIAQFNPQKYNIECYFTDGVGSATNIIKNCAFANDLVVCAGGDGTLNEVINGLMSIEKRIPLGYIPNGTTNDTAKSTVLNMPVSEICKLIDSDKKNNLDIGKLNDRYFCCTVSFGFGSNASLNTTQNMKNKIGSAAYVLSSLKSLGDITPTRLNVICDDFNASGEYVFGAIVNTTSVGGVFHLKNEDVCLNDGEFELILVRKIDSVSELPGKIIKLKKHLFDGNELILAHAKRINIECEKPLKWLVDGENGGVQSTVLINNIHNGIELYSPQGPLWRNEL